MITIAYSSSFAKEFKRLARKYPSLESDLDALEAALQTNPELGESLGASLRKVRMAVSAKHAGKRGGARVITLNCLAVGTEEGKLVLLAIYDKSEAETITTKDLRRLAKDLGY